MGRRQIDKISSQTAEMLLEEFKLIYKGTVKANRKPHLLLREFQTRVSYEIKAMNKSRERREIRFRRANAKIPDYKNSLNAALREALVSSSIPANKREEASEKIPSAETLYHEIILSVAREVWKNPPMFYHNIDEKKREANSARMILCMRDTIEETIRQMIPEALYESEEEEEEFTLKEREEIRSHLEKGREIEDKDSEEESEETHSPPKMTGIESEASEVESEASEVESEASEEKTESIKEMQVPPNTPCEEDNWSVSMGSDYTQDRSALESDEEHDQIKFPEAEIEVDKYPTELDFNTDKEIETAGYVSLVDIETDWVNDPIFTGPKEDDMYSVVGVEDYVVPQFKIIEIESRKSDEKKCVVVDKT
ncbi:hypothetical protein TetV_477 [Tetraselmis virus 1]|uniref:Uncharacterized protein n=1 Tax=Tetraselmis virus 1 TaxID=2060617 RepID=A0A2P0VP58_9VIRU|nr:hypothetical protein QJ968_gp577 [Tetraselmis virus 1]AUF82559.1 hypothetical protein TetV_477 [Tetraselmis virus 1]